METNSPTGAVIQVITSPKKNTMQDRSKEMCRLFKVILGLLTLNLVRWLSRMGSLYRQLQQLPIASAGQLKPVRETDTITSYPTQDKTTVNIYFREQAHTNFLLSPGHQCKGIQVSIPGSSTGQRCHKPVSLLD